MIKGAALRVYKKELLETGIDLGSKSVSRTSIRVICQDAVLEASNAVKRKYSYSAISSIMSVHDEKNAKTALRQLQQERLVVSRLGFPEKV